jgi:hypothetical protein
MTSSMRWAKLPCTYILTNERHTVLYVGVTSDLKGNYKFDVAVESMR